MFADLTDYQIAHYFNVSMSTVDRWRSGRALPPPYTPLTVSAIKAKLEPLDVHRFTPVTVAKTLGLSLRTVSPWYGPQVPPLAACLALAAVSPMSDVLSIVDLRLLRQIATTNYYLTGKRWKARKVMGKRLPSMRDTTPDRLITTGHVTIETGKYDAPYLKLTNKGKRYLDSTAHRA